MAEPDLDVLEAVTKRLYPTLTRAELEWLIAKARRADALSLALVAVAELHGNEWLDGYPAKRPGRCMACGGEWPCRTRQLAMGDAAVTSDGEVG